MHSNHRVFFPFYVFLDDPAHNKVCTQIRHCSWNMCYYGNYRVTRVKLLSASSKQIALETFLLPTTVAGNARSRLWTWMFNEWQHRWRKCYQGQPHRVKSPVLIQQAVNGNRVVFTRSVNMCLMNCVYSLSNFSMIFLLISSQWWLKRMKLSQFHPRLWSRSRYCNIDRPLIWA